MKSFYGFKKDQTQIFDADGKRLVISKITTKPLMVVGVKNQEKDGYQAIKVGISKRKKLTKPIAGSIGELKIKPRFIRELKIESKMSFKPGDMVKVLAVFKAGDTVKVRGITKGKGFAGGMKRWGFAGGPKTHGQSDRPRSPGSIGQGTDPGRVWKGKKMAGHMGAETKTIRGLKVVKVDEKENEVWVTGLVPGFKGGLLEITRLKKVKKAE